MELPEFKQTLEKFLGNSTRPVVAYTGLWLVRKSFPVPFPQMPATLLDILIDVVGPNRTLLMPTYTNGFKDGLIDLDTGPSTTGVMNDLLQSKSGAVRTASAFFSFTALGRDAELLGNLRPNDAWGDNSVFDYIETENAHLLTIGALWDACSFRHRVEWLGKVPYRYPKEFAGEMIRNGQRERLKETLFVRSLNPSVENEWHNQLALMHQAKMQSVSVGGGQIGEVGAQALLKVMVPVVEKDPFAFVKEPDVVRKYYEKL